MFNTKTTHLQRRKEKCIKGFSLMESLISLTIFFIVTIGSLEFFQTAKVQYFKLKEEHETNETAFAALDKMQQDFEDAGYGLLSPIQLGILSGIDRENGQITILLREKNLIFSQDLVPGQTRIELQSTTDVKENRKLCIYDSSQGEILTVSSVDRQGIILLSPLTFAYSSQNSTLSLLKSITLFLDEESKTLRRKVNTSTPQPLLDDTSTFDCLYNESTNLVFISITLLEKKDKKYETSIFPKNLELAGRQ